HALPGGLGRLAAQRPGPGGTVTVRPGRIVDARYLGRRRRGHAADGGEHGQTLFFQPLASPTLRHRRGGGYRRLRRHERDSDTAALETHHAARRVAGMSTFNVLRTWYCVLPWLSKYVRVISSP